MFSQLTVDVIHEYKNTDENSKVWQKKRKVDDIEAGFDTITNFTESQNDQVQAQIHNDVT